MIHRFSSALSLGDWDAGRLMGYFDREGDTMDRTDSWQPLLRHAYVRNINRL